MSKLTNCRVLNLSECNRIFAVKGLEKVHTLIMSGCSSLGDVTPLAGVQNLNLSGSSVTQVNPLGRVPTLNLAGTQVVVCFFFLTLFLFLLFFFFFFSFLASIFLKGGG